MTISCHIIDFQLDTQRAQEVLEGFAEGALIDPVLILVEDNEGFEANLISNKGVVKINALEYLSSLSRTDVVTLSVVVGPQTEGLSLESVAGRMERRADQIRSMVSQATEVREIRIFAPEFERQSPPIGFFANGAINVMLMPEDRASDIAVARPASSADDWFVGHVVVETASLLGLWSAIDEPPVMSHTPLAGGLGDPLIFMFRSFCRLVRGPEAVAAELLPNENTLPTPAGFLPAPDPEWLARHHAKAIFPDEFLFQCPEFDDPRGSHTPIEVLRRYISEFFKTFVQLPRFLARGFVADLDQSLGRSLQGLYGEHSWIRVELAEGESANEEEMAVSEDEIKNRLAIVSERPTLAVASPVIWTTLVHDVLGAADGSDNAKRIQQASVSKAFVLVDKEFLGYSQDSTAVELARMATAVPEIEISDGSSDHDVVELPREQPNDNSGLLSSLTSCFTSQVEECRVQLDRSVAEVLNSKQRRADFSSGTARGVVIASLAAFTSLLLVVVSTTQLRTVFSFDSISGLSRARLWVLLTLAVGYIISLCLVPKKSIRMQTFVVVATSMFTASLAAVVLFFPPIYRGVRRILDWSGDAPIYGVTGAVVAVGVVALLRHLVKSPTKGSLSIRILVVTLYLYLLLGGLVALSREGSVVQVMGPGARDKLQVFVLVVGLSTIFACLSVVTAVRVREQNSFDLWLARLKWNIKVAEYSAAEEKLLSTRVVQWLGTATVLSRLMWFPLGKGSIVESNVVSRVEALQLQKFKMAEVVLADRGKEAFTARIRRLVSGKGWLTSQYERVAGQFGRELTLRSGLLDGDVQAVRPETCSFPESASAILAGKVSSRRWEFALEFEEGAYDSVLAERVNLDDQNTLFAAVLNDSSMYQLRGSTLGSISEFLDEVAVHARPSVPPSAVRAAPVALAGAGGSLDASIWWPSSVLTQPSGDSPSAAYESSLIGSLLVAMRCDWSNAIEFSQLAGVGRSGVDRAVQSERVTDIGL